MISNDDFIWYVNDAINDMVTIVTGLGDELANSKLDIEGANSPFAILTHCLGVMEFWGGHAVAGRTVTRDRPSEFVASGAVDQLAQRASLVVDQLRKDVATSEAGDAPRGALREKDRELPSGRTQGGALVHIYEELAQHRGQMEICRDVLLSDWARRAA